MLRFVLVYAMPSSGAGTGRPMYAELTGTMGQAVGMLRGRTEDEAEQLIGSAGMPIS